MYIFFFFKINYFQQKFKVKNNYQETIYSVYAYEPRSDIRDLLAIKVKSEIFTEKERPSCCEQFRKFEGIIFTNNKDMSL